MDVQRLGQALARPGMDTRCWVCIASVKKFVLDDKHGPLADVLILSSSSSTMGDDGVAAGDIETVRVGPVYAGPGFGFYAPLDVDDEVLVAFPEGNPDHGGVIIGRLWSRSDPPPSTAVDNTADVCLHVKDGDSVRIVTSGGGKVLLGKVGEATKSVNREGDSVDMGTWQVTAVVTGIQTIQFTPPGGLPITLSLATPGPFQFTGKTKHGSDTVEASD